MIPIITVMGTGPRMMIRSAKCYWFDGEWIYSRIIPVLFFEEIGICSWLQSFI